MASAISARAALSSGAFWCALFVALDAAQAVYLGGVLQGIDAFLLGGLVFGLSAAFCFVWTAQRRPQELQAAWASLGDLIGLNIGAAFGWLLYFFAIERIEPAVAFTLFSGAIPLTALVAARYGLLGAPRARTAHRAPGRIETTGLVLLALGMLALIAVTAGGLSGFVRGGLLDAALGLFLALTGGVFIAAMLLYSAALDGAGVGPTAQFALRFPLFLVLAGLGVLLGLDPKPMPDAGALSLAVAVGLVVLALPIYAVQKAIALTSAATVGAAAALAPLVIFLLQRLEARVDFAPATLAALGLYCLGAVLMALGRARTASGP